MCSPRRSANQPDFDQLAQRLKALNIKEEKDQEAALSQIMQMDLTSLSQETIAFGKAHLGKKFESMKGETKYLTWFAENYKNSKKPHHVKFLRFIQLHVEQQEDRVRTTPQAKAKAGSSRPEPRPEMHNVDADSISSEEVWEHTPAVTSVELMTMQNRMAEMEVVMQQALAHLTQQNAAP